MTLKSDWELVVIGAGPAGLAAATLAAEKGIETLLLDEQAGPGGQIYRAIDRSPLADRAVLGADYWKGEALLAAFRAGAAVYQPNAAVWQVNRGREIGVTVGGAARLLRAERVILATGALERPFPVPGWTLPGVMTAGAGQILLKASGLVPEGRVVLAGLGPLLYLIAWQYLRAGVPIAAILETTARPSRMAALTRLPGFLASTYLRKGMSLLAEVRRRTRVVGNVQRIAAEGDGRLERVVFGRGGEEETIPADLLLLHQGVVPNVNLAMAAGCEHAWDRTQLCFAPALDRWGNSSVKGILVAGDGAGIGGAESAAHRGRLAGLDVAFQLARIDARARDWEAPRHAGQLARSMRGRAFLDRWYRPPDAFRLPEGDTLVCRCEEVTARAIADTVALGCPGPNQMKAFLRSGMGPCQGRLCGLTVSELIARARGVPVDEVGYYRLRPPVKPLTLGELAQLPADDAAIAAVVRP